MLNGMKIAKELTYEPNAEVELDEKKITDIQKAISGFYDALNDDLNTAVGLAQLFTLLKYVNMIYMNQLASAALGEETFEALKKHFILFTQEILGLAEEIPGEGESVLKGMLSLYKEYKAAQQYDKVDEIRAYFKNNRMVIKDMKHKIDWAWEE